MSCPEMLACSLIPKLSSLKHDTKAVFAQMLTVALSPLSPPPPRVSDTGVSVVVMVWKYARSCFYYSTHSSRCVSRAKTLARHRRHMALGAENCDQKCSHASVGTRCRAMLERSLVGAYLINLSSLTTQLTQCGSTIIQNHMEASRAYSI